MPTIEEAVASIRATLPDLPDQVGHLIQCRLLEIEAASLEQTRRLETLEHADRPATEAQRDGLRALARQCGLNLLIPDTISYGQLVLEGARLAVLVNRTHA